MTDGRHHIARGNQRVMIGGCTQFPRIEVVRQDFGLNKTKPRCVGTLDLTDEQLTLPGVPSGARSVYYFKFVNKLGQSKPGFGTRQILLQP